MQNIIVREEKVLCSEKGYLSWALQVQQQSIISNICKLS